MSVSTSESEHFSGCEQLLLNTRHETWSMEGMKRNKSTKLSRKLKLEIRAAALHLPKHIRDNIRHPLLRLAWFAELNNAS